MTNLESRLEEFKQAMLAKFVLRDSKHPQNSVARDTTDWLALDQDAIEEHLVAEFCEFFNLNRVDHSVIMTLIRTSENRDKPRDYTETVDLGNMAFLRWWVLREQAGDPLINKAAAEWCKRT